MSQTEELAKAFDAFLKEQEQFAKALNVSIERMMMLSLLRETKINNDFMQELLKTMNGIIQELHKLHEVVEVKKK